jgi:predicted RNA-binding Zn-ribbon protein involved in translation (DUF1610 family)
MVANTGPVATWVAHAVKGGLHGLGKQPRAWPVSAATVAQIPTISKPAAKTCSGCGVVKTELRLSERTYRCDECGLVLDRDLRCRP